MPLEWLLFWVLHGGPLARTARTPRLLPAAAVCAVIPVATRGFRSTPQVKALPALPCDQEPVDPGGGSGGDLRRQYREAAASRAVDQL